MPHSIGAHTATGTIPTPATARAMCADPKACIETHDMTAHPPLQHRAILAMAWAISGGAWAQGAVPPLISAGEPLPPRFVLCQREVQGAGGADRSAQMRACLARRLAGEKAVARNCRREAGGVKGHAARQAAQHECERHALAVPSSELPKAPPPPPRRAPVTTTASTTPAPARLVPTAAPVTQRMPSSGEQ